MQIGCLDLKAHSRTMHGYPHEKFAHFYTRLFIYNKYCLNFAYPDCEQYIRQEVIGTTCKESIYKLYMRSQHITIYEDCRSVSNTVNSNKMSYVCFLAESSSVLHMMVTRTAVDVNVTNTVTIVTSKRWPSCPTGTSNVNSYTPYFNNHLQKDTGYTVKKALD